MVKYNNLPCWKTWLKSQKDSHSFKQKNKYSIILTNIWRRAQNKNELLLDWKPNRSKKWEGEEAGKLVFTSALLLSQKHILSKKTKMLA